MTRLQKIIFQTSVVITASANFAIPSTAQYQTTKPLEFPSEKSCDLPTVQENAACTEQQAKAWNDSLNAEYRDALKRLEPERRALLLKAQRLWVQYRDANCAVAFAHEGTISGFLGQSCLLQMTKDRAKELHSLSDEDDN